LSHCYIDDSKHPDLGFATLSFVFSSEPLDDVVERAIVAAGLKPGVDEFKSGVRTVGNAPQQALREALVDIVCTHTRVGVLATGWPTFYPVGRVLLQSLQSIIIRNGILASGLHIYVDLGIFKSEVEAERLKTHFGYLWPCSIHTTEVSHLRGGIQVADLIAHTFAQAVKEAISGRPKFYDVGGPTTGWPEGTQISLSEFLLHAIRLCVLARPIVTEGEAFDPATDPFILAHDDDPTRYGLQPEVLGWGVQLAPDAVPSLRLAVQDALGTIWRGCLH
jgi:hypothetical protein